MNYKILQPKKKSILSKGIRLEGSYQKIAPLQSVIEGQQRGMMHPIQNRYDSKTKIVFY